MKTRIWITSMASLAILLSGCSNNDTEEKKGASEVKTTTVDQKNNEKDMKKEKKDSNKTKASSNQQEAANEKKLPDEFSYVTGIAHFKHEPFNTKTFGDMVMNSNFNMLGYHAGDDAGDLIEQLGDYNNKEEQEELTNYIYDNFHVSIDSNNKINHFAIFGESPTESLDIAEVWGVKNQFPNGSALTLDDHQDDNHSVVVSSEMNVENPKVYVTILGSDAHIPEQSQDDHSDIKDPRITMKNGTAYFNYPDITDFDFAYEVCTNSLKINGVGLGSYVSDKEPLGEYTEVGVVHEYGNFGFEVISTNITGIILDVSDQNVHLDDLIKGWQSKVDITQDNAIFYDNDKNNGFRVKVEFNDDKIVQSISILGDIA